MPYFTERQLEQFADSYELSKRASIHLNESKASARLSIFLSHSHKDRKKANGLIKNLADQGVDVYVDWNDSDMPRITNRVTAERIKDKISDNDLFMVLATQNALDSKWVPWEIGIADKSKEDTRVLIVPVVDYTGNFAGAEYLQLYRRVIIADDNRIGVFAPEKTQGDTLETYLRHFSK